MKNAPPLGSRNDSTHRGKAIEARPVAGPPRRAPTYTVCKAEARGRSGTLAPALTVGISPNSIALSPNVAKRVTTTPKVACESFRHFENVRKLQSATQFPKFSIAAHHMRKMSFFTAS